MTDLLLLEASLFQLNAALGGVDDAMFASQLRLTTTVLANAIAAAEGALNAARVNDIEFALNDLAAVIGELSQADADRLAHPVELLRADVASLKQATAFPAPILDEIRAFRHTLRTRQSAIERQTYVEAGATPLSPPRELAPVAARLRDALAGAGFGTESLDAFLAAPDELLFHAIGEIIDELDAASA